MSFATMHTDHIDGATDDEKAGIAWWNALTENDRRTWLDIAKSARVADAYRAYLEWRKRHYGS